MNDEKKADLVAQARISDISLRWTMTQLFFVIHSAFFSLIVVRFQPGTVLFFGASMLGLALSIFWFIATKRAQRQIEFWNEKLAELEQKQERAAREEHPVLVFVTEDGRVLSPPGIPIYLVLRFLVWLFVAIWVSSAAYGGYQYFGPRR